MTTVLQRPKRAGTWWTRLGVAIVLASALWALWLVAPSDADARLFAVVAMNGAQDPVEEIRADDALFAYVTTDLTGGRVCVIPGTASDGSCDSPAWGGSTPVAGLGSLIVPIQPPYLRIGYWRLLGDSSGGSNVVSQPFYVVSCGQSCDSRLGQAAVDEWKLKAGFINAADRSADLCAALSLVDLAGDLKSGGMVLKKQGDFMADVIGQGLKYGPNRLFTYAVSASFAGLPGSVGGFLLNGVTNIPIASGPAKRLLWLGRVAMCRTADMFEAIKDDPPDPNFTEILEPDFTVWATTEMPEMNELLTRQAAVEAYARAQLHAFEKYLGADAASNEIYVHAQLRAVALNGDALGPAMRELADALRAYAEEIDADPELGSAVLTASARDAMAAQFQRIATNGFLPEELQQLQDEGLTQDEIDAVRAQLDPVLIAAAPTGVTLGHTLRKAADQYDEISFAMEDFARAAEFVAANTNVAPDASFTAAPVSSFAPLEIAFNNTSTSPDLDPIESIEWQFGDGTMSSDDSPSHTYAASGVYTARLTVCDYLDCDTAQQTINVGGANRDPIAVADTGETFSATPATIDVLANDTDPDGDQLTVTGTRNVFRGTASCTPSGICTYTPNPDFGFGEGSFVYEIADGRGGTASATVRITIQSTRDTAAISSVTGDAAGAAALAGAMTAVPGNVSAASFAAVPGSGTPNGVAGAPLNEFPVHGSSFAILTSGNVAFADDANFGANTTASIVGPNVRGDTDWDVTVLKIDLSVPQGANCLRFDFKFFSEEFPEFVNSNFNDAFIAELDTSTWTTSGSTITAPNNFAFDPSGDVISINSSGNTAMSVAETSGTTYDGATPRLSAATHVTPGAHSLYLSIFDQGDRIYDSAVFLDNLVIGFVPNPEEQCAEGAVPSGFELTLSPASATNDVGTQHTVTATLTESGSAATGKAISFAVTGANAESGSAVTDSNGEATFTYTATGSGYDSIFACYDADGDAECTTSDAIASATKEWIDPGAPPDAVDDSLATNEDTAGPKDVLANDAGPSLTVTSFTQGAHGSVSCTPAGACTYTPDPGFSGADSFTYTASNGDGNDTATVAVTVNPVNDPPVATDDTATTSQGVAKDVNVLANDSDPDGDTMVVASNTQSANGSVSCTPAGVCTYTPDAGFSGTDSFTYTVSDGHGGTDTATVNVTVTPVGQASVSGKGVFNTAGNGKVSFTLSSTAVNLTRLTGAKFTFDGVVANIVGGAGTATMTGTGTWKGVAGHTFEIAVVDKGSPGYRKGDTIAVVIRNASGATVFSWGPERLKTGDIAVTGSSPAQ